MKKFICLFLLVVFPSVSFAEFSIPSQKQVPNESPGLCVWSSAETLGNHYNISELKGLVKKWKIKTVIPGVEIDLADHELSKLQVKHLVKHEKDYDLLRRTLVKHIGIIVGVKEWPGTNGHHAIILTHLDDSRANYVDTNHVGVRYESSTSWFEKNWTGYMIIIYPK